MALKGKEMESISVVLEKTLLTDAINCLINPVNIPIAIVFHSEIKPHLMRIWYIMHSVISKLCKTLDGYYIIFSQQAA